MDLVECAGCGEEYPVVACKHKCPSCGLAEGAPVVAAKEPIRKFRDDD